MENKKQNEKTLPTENASFPIEPIFTDENVAEIVPKYLKIPLAEVLSLEAVEMPSHYPPKDSRELPTADEINQRQLVLTHFMNKSTSVRDCITLLKKFILPTCLKWNFELQHISEDIDPTVIDPARYEHLCTKSENLRGWSWYTFQDSLINFKRKCNAQFPHVELPPLPSDILGVKDWITSAEKALAKADTEQTPEGLDELKNLPDLISQLLEILKRHDDCGLYLENGNNKVIEGDEAAEKNILKAGACITKALELAAKLPNQELAKKSEIILSSARNKIDNALTTHIIQMAKGIEFWDACVKEAFKNTYLSLNKSLTSLEGEIRDFLIGETSKADIDTEYSIAIPMTKWADILNMSENKLRELRGKKYHFDQISSRKWRLPKREIPTEYLEKYRKAEK
jgi:hypothetical protein